MKALHKDFCLDFQSRSMRATSNVSCHANDRRVGAVLGSTREELVSY